MQHVDFVISFISLRLGSSDAVALTTACVIDLYVDVLFTVEK